jgi:hypothetical protein
MYEFDSNSELKDFIGKPQKMPLRPMPPLGLPVVVTRNRQVQTAGQAGQQATQQTVQTLNQPTPVSNIAVRILKTGTQRSVSISFQANASDPNFQKVNIHLKLGQALPVIVAQGPQSPVVFTVPSTRYAATIFVQAEGNWGPHPLQNSPSRSLSLM